MIKEQLQQLGFTPNQIKVYLALFDLGQSKVGAIIKQTGLHRNIIYRALDDLEKRQLVFHLQKSGVAYYQTTSPEPLLAEVKAQEQVASQVVRELSKRQTQTPAEVLLFSGEQGIEELFQKVLEEGEDLYLIGANGEVAHRYPDIVERFEKERIKKKIKRHHLAIKETADTSFNELEQCEVKYLPAQFSSPNVTWVFGNKIAHVLWEQPEIVFFINNERIAQDYRKYFDLLWKEDVVTYSGKQSPDEAFGKIADTLEAGETVDIMGIHEFDEDFRDAVLRFHKKRSGKKISARFLMNHGTTVMREKLETLPYTEIRMMDKEVATPAIFLIYKDTTLISLGDEFSFFEITNKTATTAFRAYFDLLWKQSEKSA
jgi:sugar-specific transcriptional regulator TrmB